MDLERQRGAQPKVTGSQVIQIKKAEAKVSSAEEQALQCAGNRLLFTIGRANPESLKESLGGPPIVTEQGNPGIYVQIDEWLSLYKGNIYVVDEVTGRMYLQKGSISCGSQRQLATVLPGSRIECVPTYS